MIFLSDKGREYTYGDLLSAVNTACSYKPLYRASGLYPYFVNFLTALVAGAPVVLLDSDLSPLELDGVDERAVNSETDLPQHVAFDNIGGLIEAVFSSQSQITIFTSGTTGQPKEVVHTVQSLSRCKTGRQIPRLYLGFCIQSYAYGRPASILSGIRQWQYYCECVQQQPG